MKKVLFVCLGNICRSPLAEGVLKNYLLTKGNRFVEVDSCGTSRYHTGEQPDPRTRKNAEQNCIVLSHQARQLEDKDFIEFDFLLAMDNSNLNNMRKLRSFEQNRNKVSLLRDFDPQNPGADVPDPYFGGDRGFQEVFEIVERSVISFYSEKLESIFRSY